MRDVVSLLRAMIADPAPFRPTRESPAFVQVERATVLADALAGRPVELPPRAVDIVIDAGGHRRGHYRSVLAYAYRAVGVPAEVVQPWIVPPAEPPLTAALGSVAAAAAWVAVAVGGAVARATLHRFAAAQQASGALLRATPADNPETRWYHELVILHAMADHVATTADPFVAAAVERACLFHLTETEPDHATGQPWGLSAFVRVPAAAPLVASALHGVAAHQPAGPTGLTLFLLADTVYGLTRPPPAEASSP